MMTLGCESSHFKIMQQHCQALLACGSQRAAAANVFAWKLESKKVTASEQQSSDREPGTLAKAPLETTLENILSAKSLSSYTGL